MILVIDNFDSFVYNLARYLQRLGQTTLVERNDAIHVDKVRSLAPQAIVISPGPCAPQQAEASLEIVRELHSEFPILGVCLGHQTIAEAFGARIVRAKTPVHGRTSLVSHHAKRLFADLPSPLTACRYHSLVVDPSSLPTVLMATAWTEDGTLMAVEHARLPVFGLQFHPEAILTEHGYDLLANFLRIAGLEITSDSRTLARGELRARTRPASPLPAGPVTF